MQIERRFAEFRAEGRSLVGVVVSYADVARLPFGRERFAPGAFGDLGAADVILNLQHDRSRPLARTQGGGLELADTADALTVRAELPETRDGNDALDLVRRRVLRGFSMEFGALREAMDDRVRVVERAELRGIGLVDRPAYQGSTVEVRRRIGGLSGRVPYRKSLGCRCKAGCKSARFEKGSLKQAAEGEGELLAIRGSYADTLASKKAGTLRLTETDEGLAFEMDIPSTTAGNDIAELSGAAKLLARPVWDEAESVYRIENETAIVERAKIKAFLVGATDADEGWPPVKYTPAEGPARRRWL